MKVNDNDDNDDDDVDDAYYHCDPLKFWNG